MSTDTASLSAALDEQARQLTQAAKHSGTYGDFEAKAHAIARVLRALAREHDHA